MRESWRTGGAVLETACPWNGFPRGPTTLAFARPLAFEETRDVGKDDRRENCDEATPAGTVNNSSVIELHRPRSVCGAAAWQGDVAKALRSLSLRWQDRREPQ